MMCCKKPLFLACVCFSVFFHALMLYLFQIHSLWFSAPPLPLKEPCLWETVKRSAILREVFQDQERAIQTAAVRAPKKMETPEMLRANLTFLRFQPPEMELEALLPSSVFRPSDLLSCSRSLPSHLCSPPPTLHPFSINGALASFECPAPRRDAPPLSPSSQLEPSSFAALPPPSFSKPEIKLIAYEENNLIQSDFPAEAQVKKKVSLAIPPPPLPTFPTLGELETDSYSDSFDLEIVCNPREDGQGGYFFAATLIPHQDLCLPKIRQHYSFLIDRANSIQRERLLATKSAVLRALSELKDDDTFNIIVFDSKVEKVFPQNTTPTSESLSVAKAFLDKIQLGSFFAPADLYNPLFLTLPHPAKENEVYTAILMTDGENFSKKTGIRSILQTWTMQNSGNICLYTLGMGGDPNLPCLDVASVLNRGRLYSSPTKRGIKRKLLKLMKNIHSPIAKNLSARAITTSGQSIELFPKGATIPHLYLDQPIAILGSTDSLDDFILFVQGRCKDSWFNIKKKISFINAKKGGSSLRKEWALQQAYRCYERYTLDDNPEHLAEARRLLTPFDIQPAFE